jgi:hypothetical protein
MYRDNDVSRKGQAVSQRFLRLKRTDLSYSREIFPPVLYSARRDKDTQNYNCTWVRNLVFHTKGEYLKTRCEENIWA